MSARHAEQLIEEEYAHSLSSLRRLGSYATTEAVAAEHREAAAELAYKDFKTAVTEMLKTDGDYRYCLDLENSDEYRVIDGQACAADGVPIVDKLADGLASSILAKQSNPELEAQVERDQADLDNAKIVDQLTPGTTRIVLSLDPRDELKRHKKTYSALGYREGLSYLQWYSKTETSVVAGSFSVDQSDQAIWRDIFRENGVEIPEGESPNKWIRHGIELAISPAQAKQMVQQMRSRHYQRLGREKKRYSVTEFVDLHESTLQSFFDTYYLALSEAVYTGQNSQQLQSLAAAILSSNIEKLDPSIRSQLILIANSSKFKPDSAKVMDSIIRYAATEELRKSLQAFISQPKAKLSHRHYPGLPGAYYQLVSPQLLAANIVSGILAGREYGGCPGQIKLSIGDLLASESDHSSQEAYGGKSCPEIKDGQLVKCPGCKKMVKAVVIDRKDIYCSNPNCKLARH